MVVGVGRSGFFCCTLPIVEPFFEKDRVWGDGVGVGVVRGNVAMAIGGTKVIPAGVYGLGIRPAEPGGNICSSFGWSRSEWLWVESEADTFV